jgi:CubicO group peptidase (beta-lactamase class C family)
MRTALLLPALYPGSLLILLWACAPVGGQSFDWTTATPESQGFSKEKLGALARVMAARKTKTFLVIRNDRIVYEWYAEDHQAAKTHSTASLAKALVGGLSLSVAVTDGSITLDDSAARYVAQWKDDPRKSKITLRQLGSHTSGLADAESDEVPHEKLTGWKGDFWKRLAVPRDPFSISRDRTEILSDPGKQIRYSNPGFAMLTYCVTAAIKDTKHKDIRTLLRERVMRPIGVPDREWSIGYGMTFDVDGLPLVPSWGGGAFTGRAAARIGRLVLREGDWDGKRLLSKAAVRDMTQDAGLPGRGGMGWWTNKDGRYRNLPKDAVWGAGAGDQVLLVIPSLNLIMVRNGRTLEPGPDEPPVRKDDVFTRYHDYRARILFEPLVAAMTKERVSPALPPESPVIRSLTWAPRESIVRKAKGSDNWPITWGDDDRLYTAYGDGWGFEPLLREKLSLGFARVEGGLILVPGMGTQLGEFKGVNLRSPTGEQKGQGKDGKKASGILMVNGVLYLWVRNAGNAQLAWSGDHGRTWEWPDWKFTSGFGCPTFLNFGKNHAGARDDYVYVYSHDADSAYQAADRMVLARVPSGKIRRRDAYEFFQGFDAKRQPIWTRDIAERGAVFSRTGRCWRSGITYNPGLKRYLWCQTLPGKDPRFAGGLGIYDAPEPWGPWTTVYHTEAWDVGPGETSSFPTKWMSADGTVLYLVFSGEDTFSVRKATITLR